MRVKKWLFVHRSDLQRVDHFELEAGEGGLHSAVFSPGIPNVQESQGAGMNRGPKKSCLTLPPPKPYRVHMA